jgi:hypothetical protein
MIEIRTHKNSPFWHSPVAGVALVENQTVFSIKRYLAQFRTLLGEGRRSGVH